MMPESSILVFAALAAQTAGAAVIAVLLYGFLRQYGKSYLQHLTASWAALCVFRLGETAEVVTRMRAPHAAAGIEVISVISGIAGYLQIAWLLFGVYELLRRRPVRLRVARQVIVALAVVGAVIALFPGEPFDSTIRAVVAACAFFLGGAGFWRSRKRGGVAFTMTALTFFVYAVEQVHFVVVTILGLGYAPYLGMFDFLIQSMIGLGMIACLLEDEREAAE